MKRLVPAALSSFLLRPAPSVTPHRHGRATRHLGHGPSEPNTGRRWQKPVGKDDHLVLKSTLFPELPSSLRLSRSDLTQKAVTCGILACNGTTSGLGGPWVRRPPDCLMSVSKLVPSAWPAPPSHLPRPAEGPRSPPSLGLQTILLPGGEHSSRLLLAGRWASGPRPWLRTNLLRHSKAHTVKQTPPSATCFSPWGRQSTTVLLC